MKKFDSGNTNLFLIATFNGDGHDDNLAFIGVIPNNPAIWWQVVFISLQKSGGNVSAVDVWSSMQ